uniref:Uncharacterized protein n=1 Tax=Leviviridae sp. TaxID=2027243 RepID=A0A514CZY3_9VIRU|nr:MAG: hypothetical protein H4Bulk462434_000003 [Leviviridae sp.]
MLADPQSVTINSVANSLPAIARGVNNSAYQKDDGTVKLSISHQYGKRTRRTARLDFSKIVADPLVTTQNQKVSMSAYLVVDHPITGLTNTEQKQIVDALTAYLTASTGANVTAILGGQS